MTTLDEGLIAYLKGYAGLVALVSTRIYGMMIPQGAILPCVTIQRVSTPRISTMDTSGATGDLINPRYQVDTWTTTQASGKAIMDVLRAALNGHRGSTGGVTVRSILAQDEIPEYEPDTGLYRGRSEYTIWYEE